MTIYALVVEVEHWPAEVRLFSDPLTAIAYGNKSVDDIKKFNGAVLEEFTQCEEMRYTFCAATLPEVNIVRVMKLEVEEGTPC